MIDHSYFFRFKIYSTQSSPSLLVFLLENHFFTNLSFKQFCFIFHFIRMWDFIKRSLQTSWSFAQDLISNALMRCQCQILQILNYFSFHRGLPILTLSPYYVDSFRHSRAGHTWFNSLLNQIQSLIFCLCYSCKAPNYETNLNEAWHRL